MCHWLVNQKLAHRYVYNLPHTYPVVREIVSLVKIQSEEWLFNKTIPNDTLHVVEEVNPTLVKRYQASGFDLSEFNFGSWSEKSG